MQIKFSFKLPDNIKFEFDFQLSFSWDAFKETSFIEISKVWTFLYSKIYKIAEVHSNKMQKFQFKIEGKS